MPRYVNLPLDADRNAPAPCENHTAYCDITFPNGCPWYDCGNYRPEHELEDEV